MSNTQIYDAVSRPPGSALKRIGAGRLKGMSDINPQWRYRIMTEQFGPCGIGWRYEITKLWLDQGNVINPDTGDSEQAAFAMINLFIKHDGEWSEAIPGIGGSAFVTSEKYGPHTSDEAYKMAVTDALSVAMKSLGVAADIYMGLWDGSKYRDTHINTHPTGKPTATRDDLSQIKEAREKAGLSQTDVVRIMEQAPFSCENPPNDLLKMHVPALLEKIEKANKGS